MRRRKNSSLFLLILLLLGISLGYALLTQDLTINGVTKLKGNSWDIHFENVQINSNSVALSTDDSAAEIDEDDNTLIEYTVTLNKPGDFYEFTVDVSNTGTIPGKISIFSLSGMEDYLDVIDYTVKYTYAYNLSVGDILNARSKKNITVRVFYKRNIEEDDLLTEDSTLNLQFRVQYVQSDEIEEHPIYVLPRDMNGYSSKNGNSFATKLLEGTEVTVQSVDGDWMLVRTASGQERWLFIWTTDGMADVLGAEKGTEKKVNIFTDRRTVMRPGETVHLTSYLIGFDTCSTIVYRWECDKNDGEGYQAVEGGDQDHYEYSATVETLAWSWKLRVFHSGC